MKLFEVATPSEADIVKLAAEFKKEYDGPAGEDEWGDTLAVCASEHGNWSMVSSTFIDWLKARGISSRFISGQGAINKKWAETPRHHDEGDGHTAVRIGSTVVDFTARQFDKKFPIPRIYDVGDFDSEWKDVDD